MKCPKCNHNGAYIRITTQEIVCNNCGAVTPKPKEEVKEATA